VGEIFDQISYLVLFYGLLATLLFVYTGDALDIRRAWFIAVFFVVNFFLRRITKIAVLSLAIHLCVPILLLIILPFEIYTMIWILACLISAIHSTVYPFNNEPASASSFVVTSTILFVILSLVAGSRGYWPLVAIYPPIIVGIAIGRHMLMRMLQMNKSLGVTQSTSQKPVVKILAFDYKVTIGLVVLMVGMIMAFYVFVIGPALRLAVDIFPGLPDIEFSDAPPPIVPATPPEGVDISDIFEAMPERSNIFMLILGWLLRMAFSLIAVAAVSGLLILIVRIIIRFIGLRSQGQKQMEDTDGYEDEKEFMFPVEKWRNRRRKIFGKNEHPVRRLFRETAQKHIKNGVPIIKSDTPTEIANRIQTENIGGLVEEYSQVRYNG